MKLAVGILSDGSNPHVEAFREVAEAMHAALLDLGHDSLLVTGHPPDRRCIVLGLAAYPGAELRDDTIIYNMEQVGSPWFTPALVAAYQRHTVWDYSAVNAASYHALRLRKPQVVPFGHHLCLERFAPIAPQDIDVLHIGSVNVRRAEILDALSARGLNVMRLFNVYGAERDAYLARTKVLLNVHYYRSAIFEQARVHYAVANQVPVVSECSAGGEGYNLALCDDYDALPLVVPALVASSTHVRTQQAGWALGNLRDQPMTAALQAALEALL